MANGIQCNCIATLDSPSTIGETHILSEPVEDWETVGAPVNEGAAPLYHDGKIWVAYSASYCWTANYSLALLEYDGAGDPLDSASWTKSQGPVFVSADGNYGTGHNGFVSMQALFKVALLTAVGSSRALMVRRSGISTTQLGSRRAHVTETGIQPRCVSNGMRMGRQT
jgi:GH43 family beta-xylosidase